MCSHYDFITTEKAEGLIQKFLHERRQQTYRGKSSLPDIGIIQLFILTYSACLLLLIGSRLQKYYFQSHSIQASSDVLLTIVRCIVAVALILLYCTVCRLLCLKTAH